MFTIVLNFRRNPFFEMNNSLTATDVADVSVYGGTAKNGVVKNDGNYSIFDDKAASFNGSSITNFPNDLFE